MSNEEETELTEEELKRKPNKIIEVRHTMENKGNKGESPEEIEKLKKDLQEKTDVLALIALREFSDEKEKLLSIVPSEKREELNEYIDDTDKLKIAKKIYNPSEEEETETPAPSGRATLGIRTASETPTFDVERGYSDPWIQKITDLYDIIGSNKSSAEDKLKAERTLDNLYAEMRKGLKDRKNKGLTDYVYPKNARFGWTCQNCGKTNQTNQRPETGIPCKFCGYKFGIDPTPTHPFS